MIREIIEAVRNDETLTGAECIEVHMYGTEYNVIGLKTLAKAIDDWKQFPEVRRARREFREYSRLRTPWLMVVHETGVLLVLIDPTAQPAVVSVREW